MRSVQEAIDLVNEREKPLALHVFSNDNAVFQRFSAETSSGALLRNDCILHVSGSGSGSGSSSGSGSGSGSGRGISPQRWPTEKAIV